MMVTLGPRVAAIALVLACSSPAGKPAPRPANETPAVPVAPDAAAEQAPAAARESRSCAGLWQVTIPEGTKCEMAELAGTWSVPIDDSSGEAVVGGADVDLVEAINGEPAVEIVAESDDSCEMVVSAHNQERDPVIVVELEIELRDAGGTASGTAEIAVRDPESGAAECVETIVVGVVRAD